MNKTSIEWTDYSSNLIKYRDPEGRTVHGCVKVSAGCANCYASAISKRFSGGEFTASRQKTLTPFFDEKEAQSILRSKATGAKVFIGDMTDVFGHWVPDELLDRMFAVFALRPDLVFQVLTKRPERMRAYLSERARRWAVTSEAFTMICELAPRSRLGAGVIISAEDGLKEWPLPNAWLGTSVENQAAMWRVAELVRCPAAVLFVSAEPLLGETDFVVEDEWIVRQQGSHRCGRCSEIAPYCGCRRIDWVIVGGESGPGARPCDLAWIRGIVRQCKAAGTAVFVKQAGSKPIEAVPRAPGSLGRLVRHGDLIRTEDGRTGVIQADLSCKPPFLEGRGRAYRPMRLRDRAGRDMSEWPEDLRVRQYPDV